MMLHMIAGNQQRMPVSYQGPFEPPFAESAGDISPSSLRDHSSLPSSKVAVLVSEVDDLETKCNQLEQRNSWLTTKLLRSQQSFVEQWLLGHTKVNAARAFRGWRNSMEELKLERHLEEQTDNLDQCQRLAAELGATLTQEQAARNSSEAEYRGMQDDLQRALQQEKKLKSQLQAHQMEVQLLEQRLQAAETCLQRSRGEAQRVLEAHMAYDERKRKPDMPAAIPRRNQVSTVEYSIKKREEAHGMMQKMSGLLSGRVSPSGTAVM